MNASSSPVCKGIYECIMYPGGEENGVSTRHRPTTIVVYSIVSEAVL